MRLLTTLMLWVTVATVTADLPRAIDLAVLRPRVRRIRIAAAAQFGPSSGGVIAVVRTWVDRG